jgi:hypothetical protein
MEQVEVGAAVHLPLEHFDLVNGAFHPAGAVGEGEPNAVKKAVIAGGVRGAVCVSGRSDFSYVL